MKTPFPWFRHGRILVGVRNGQPDLKRPVATFIREEDAETTTKLLTIRDEVLTALRDNLKLLEEELQNRRLSGVPQYIGPVEIAVDRTKKTIAIAEVWI